MPRPPLRASVAALCVSAITVTGCSNGSATWSDAARETAPAVVGDVAYEDERMRIVTGDFEGEPCVQLTVDDVTLFCSRNDFVAGTGGGSVLAARQARGTRFIEIQVGAGARWFVVWSSASPDGRRVPAVQAGDNSVLVWIMAEGETPWGVQTIGPDDGLWHVHHLTGFDAD